MVMCAGVGAVSVLLLMLCHSGDLAVLKVTSPISIITPDPYPDGLNLIYDIEAPDGKVIGFVIKELDIRTSENGTCGKGADNLRLGRVTRRWTLDILAEICGQDVPAAPICTNSPRAYMRFMTQLPDPSERGHRGFSLDIVFMDSGPLWFDGVCGISKYLDAGELQDLPAPRIVGGILARDGEFPWQVAILTEFVNRNSYCGAIIINEWWVATAAHCIANVTGIRVRAGSNNLNAGGVLHRAESWIDHPAVFIQGNITRNDLSLIKLRTPLPITDDIRPICAPVPQTDYSHRRAVISGFGEIDGINRIKTEQLHYASVNITTREECEDIWRFPILVSEVCIADNRRFTQRSSCRGDSGGPLAVREDCGFVLLGAASWANIFCQFTPAVYADIQYFSEWITNIISNN